MLFGMLLSAGVLGYISDILGRRLIFMSTLLAGGLFVAATGFSMNFPMLCVLVVLMGMGIGGNFPLVAASFLEFVPKQNQRLVSLLSTFRPLGQVLTGLVAWIIIPRPGLYCADAGSCPSETNRGWRLMQFVFGILTVGILLLSLCFFKVLESPRYLLSRGRYDEVVSTLKNLAKMNGKHITATAQDFERLSMKDMQADDAPKSNKLREIFSGDLRMTTVLILFIYITVSLGNFVSMANLDVLCICAAFLVNVGRSQVESR
jgi:MFS family permease